MSMDIEKDVKTFKEDKEQRKWMIASGIGALVGGMIGGYPGMKIGMAIGGYLFKPEPPKDKDTYNEDYKLYRAKIDPVPDVIGTDMCPGKIIYLNKSTFGIYDSGQLPEMGNAATEAAWKEYIDMLSVAKIGQWAEFAVNFSGQYYQYGSHEYEIGVVRFNNKPIWFWMMFSDMFENYDNPLSPYQPISFFSGSQDYWFQDLEINTIIDQPVKFDTVVYYKGFIADFTNLSTDPEQSNFMIDLNNIAEFNPGQFQMGSLNAFPTFTVEMNRDAVFMSPESMQGGAELPTFSWWTDPDGGQWDTINIGSYYGTRDGRNRMYYGVSYHDAPVYIDPVERKWRFAGNDSPSQYFDDLSDWFDANITKGGTELQATDVFENRGYICTYRNWWNPYQGRGVYGMDRVNHHHANYGVKLDIYYHDLDDPEYKVHSLLFNQEFSLSEDESSCPRLYFNSMVVSDDSIYLFGGKVQTDVILYDYRTIVSGDNSYSKIYCDLSAYPDGWWEGCYASLQQNGYDLFREIITQTSTYIEVDGEFAAFPSVGEVVMLSKHPTQVTDYAIVGEGSTTTKIICNPPPVSPWSYGGGKAWECVHYIGSWLYRVNIDYIEDDTVVHLTSALSRTPVPGERICFGFDRVGSDYDTDITNPTLDEDPYDYTNFFLEYGAEHGFAPSYWTPSDPQWPFRPGTISESVDGATSHHICLKIDKTTGAISLLDETRTLGWVYFTSRGWTASVQAYAVATDQQAFVYSHGSSYPTWKQAYTYIIDFDTGIEEQINRRNQYAESHAPMWWYSGVTSVKEWDSVADDWVDVWYAMLYNFDSFEGLNDSLEQGIYFLKLGEGKFSNKQVISSNSPLEYGLDINRRGIEKILYRPTVGTGPTVFAMDLGSFPSENSYKIGKYSIRDHIYFYVHRSNSGTYGYQEMWKFIPPSDMNPAGELYMISKYPIEVDNVKYEWNRINSGGSFRLTTQGFYGNGTGLWYHCDESPPTIISYFWNWYNDPKYIPDDLVNKLNYTEAQTICNTLVDATVITPSKDIVLKERRFQFSQCYDQPKKMFDVIREILETCQGFISPCYWNSGTYYKIMIPNPDETPVHYFGTTTAQFTSNQLSDDKSKIYADFSAYPDNFWLGDEVDFGEIMDMIYPWPDSRTSVVIEQTSTYIDMGIALNDYWPDAKQFTLTKDNIKEGSFTFAEKSYFQRPNKVRIEFKNRLLDYAKDVAEAEDAYRLDVLGEPERIDFYKMHGIKRGTQAGRLALRILDQWNYQKYVCGFETDVMGMRLCMGEIIAVAHDTTGWNYKWFRIISMEELMDFEVKFELEEYNPYCYHDSGVPVMNGFGYGGFPQPYIPNQVQNFTVHEDIEFNRLYFTFNSPNNDGGFFVGARIYRKVGTEYEYVSIITETVSSVRLAQDVSVDDTTIYYDPDYLIGTFPSEGILWIENELVYYHGVDTTNYVFTNVVRGYKDTDIVEHLAEDEIILKLRTDATQYLEVDSSWIGTTQTFKAAAFTIQSLTADLSVAPLASIDVVGYGLLPYFPESIHQPISELPELQYLFEVIGLSGNLDEIERIIESLGLGDAISIPETIIQIVEDLGLDDSATIAEALTFLAESLGLGDDLEYIETIEYITESLGLNDTSTIAEMLVAISESLGLGDDLDVGEQQLAWWEFEDGALTVDSIGTNTLTNNNSVTADTSEFKQGLASGNFASASNQFMDIADASLDTGFPFKSGNTDTVMTICFWVYPKTVSGEQVLVGKYEYYNNKRQWTLNMYGGNDIRFVMSTNGTSATSYWSPLVNIFTVNTWTHLALVIDDPNSQIKLRAWQEYGDTLEDSDWDSYSGNIYDGGSLFHIGAYGNGNTPFNGLIDDVRVFNYILTDTEIDNIRYEAFGLDSIMMILNNNML